MERRMKLAPAWREYAKVREEVAQRRMQRADDASKLGLDLDMPSNIPSAKQSTFNSPCLSLSISCCENGDYMTLPKKSPSSALQDTIVRLKAEVADLKTLRLPVTKPKPTWEVQWKDRSQDVTFVFGASEGRGGRTVLEDKSTQVVFRDRKLSGPADIPKSDCALFSQDSSQIDFEGIGEFTTTASDEETPVFPTLKHYDKDTTLIPFSDEKQYEFFSEGRSRLGWLEVREQRGMLLPVNAPSQPLRIGEPQHREVFVSDSGATGGFLLRTRPAKTIKGQRLVRVRAFGHCIQLSANQLLCSSIVPMQG